MDRCVPLIDRARQPRKHSSLAKSFCREFMLFTYSFAMFISARVRDLDSRPGFNNYPSLICLYVYLSPLVNNLNN